MFQSLCETNVASRYIQRQLGMAVESKNGGKKDSKKIYGVLFNFYSLILPFAHILSTQTHGYYIINKFLTLSQESGHISLILSFIDNVICPNLRLFLKNAHSCRIIQNLLNNNSIDIKKWTLSRLIYKLQHDKNCMLSKDLLYLMDENSNYVIQDIIRNSKYLDDISSISFILQFIINISNLEVLTVNQYGCLVVQSLLTKETFVKLSDEDRNMLVRGLYVLLPLMCNNKYGNYCVQKCLDLLHLCQNYNEYFYQMHENFIEYILFGINQNLPFFGQKRNLYTLPENKKLDYMQRNFSHKLKYTQINFSKFGFGKYSSNVCETAFKYANTQQQYSLICQITKWEGRDATNTVFFGLINHQCGNFVAKNIISQILSKISIDINQVMIDIVFNYVGLLSNVLNNYHSQLQLSYSKSIVAMMQRYKMAQNGHSYYKGNQIQNQNQNGSNVSSFNNVSNNNINNNNNHFGDINTNKNLSKNREYENNNNGYHYHKKGYSSKNGPKRHKR